MGRIGAARQTHFVGVLVPEDVADAVEDCRAWMRREFGCRSGQGTLPHVTLVPPFALPPGTPGAAVEEAAALAVRECAARGGLPFPVRVEGFGAFAERTLFARVEPSPGWDGLRSALYAALSECAPGAVRKGGRAFVPHLTVANRDIPPGALGEALRHFAAAGFSAAFPAAEVGVFVRTRQGGWTLGGVARA